MEEYETKRQTLVSEENYQRKFNSNESSEAFDASVIAKASETERRANDIVEMIQNSDFVIYKNDGKTVGDSFLKNAATIKRTELFHVARNMPKGSHLHCHFNTGLDPSFGIEQARGRLPMCIKSTLPLTTQENKDKSEIAFQVYPLEDDNDKGTAKNKDIFSDLYNKDQGNAEWMRYKDFCDKFDGGQKACEKWLTSKMVLTEKQVYENQTPEGVWKLFSICTRMAKGLFNYESAFRSYIQAFIQSLIDDNIQWAEFRLNFPANILWTDDGKQEKTNYEILKILKQEAEATKKTNSLEGKYFGGWKVIYCCPRSFSTEVIANALEECKTLYLKFPEMICGFDLVGPEFDAEYTLKRCVPEFLAFRRDCDRLGISEQQLPFMFHAGETTEHGGLIDGNLYDALLLKPKRIGHGFALAQHPLLMQMYRDQKIALEICPISNEILHLCSRISEHALTTLLANNVPCTLNCDNSTYFSSSLSLEFCQVMIGSKKMTLHGWRALAEWSLEYSCMDSKQKAEITAEWERRWNVFCQWIIDTYAEKYKKEDQEDLLIFARMSSETMCRLETNDSGVLTPIEFFGIAYTEWCRNRCKVGDPESVKEFKGLLRSHCEELIPSHQDSQIQNWCQILLVAFDNWRSAYNLNHNLSTFIMKVFKILDHFNLKLGEEKVLVITFHNSTLASYECRREIRYKIKLSNYGLLVDKMCDEHFIYSDEQSLSRLHIG